VGSDGFDTMQVPFNALNPSAGYPMPGDFGETDYGNIMADCAAQGMGVFAIRVFAGGALVGAGPSAHTLKTPFFPLALYERDQRRAARLRERLGERGDLASLGLCFVLGHPHISSAIVGFRTSGQIDEVVRAGVAALPAGRLEDVLRIAATPLP
jgi:aryl-alcohol dehydrogenase-like predicted oxidoreductase